MGVRVCICQCRDTVILYHQDMQQIFTKKNKAKFKADVTIIDITVNSITFTIDISRGTFIKKCLRLTLTDQKLIVLSIDLSYYDDNSKNGLGRIAS